MSSATGSPVFERHDVVIYHGDCRAVMAALPECVADAIVTDPPYGLGFMGKGWDHGVPVDWIPEALRVLKPGGHLVAFGGTRTYHRLVCALEDAGFEIRDCLMWLYGSGFPKSLDVSKEIDKAAEDARTWQGWGTALKPAWEPIVLARKPLGEGTVAANVLRHGTGALNVDGCRIAATDGYTENAVTQGIKGARTSYVPAASRRTFEPQPLGRWPANLALDAAAAALLDAQSGERTSGLTGGASRFFYTAKADREDRDGSKHPTVKPQSLMRWLITLVAPRGASILDPFLGSGSTLAAARSLGGYRAIGIEQDAQHVAEAINRFRQEALALDA